MWAEEDLVVADEFRDGNVPAGMQPLSVARRAFQSLPDVVTERAFRGDSACYEDALLKWLSNADRDGGPSGRIDFSISADMTVELQQVCQRVEAWKPLEDRVSETVDWSEVEFTPGNWKKDDDPLRYIALRITKKVQGDLFDSTKPVRYLAVVSNRRGMTAPELIKWHWAKAGTIEHVHDVMKNELGAGTLPSKLFGANAAWYRLCGLTYNVLSFLKRQALPERLRRARPHRLRFEFFTMPAKIAEPAGRMVVKPSALPSLAAELIQARRRLLAIHQAGSARSLH
jgi:hypothetical protein